MTSEAAVLVWTSHSCVVVAVPPQHELLEQEEGQDAAEQRHERLRGLDVLEGLGQQRQQRHAEQRTDRVADQPRNDLHADAIAEQQKRRCREQAADAAQHAQAHGGPVRSSLQR